MGVVSGTLTLPSFYIDVRGGKGQGDRFHKLQKSPQNVDHTPLRFLHVQSLNSRPRVSCKCVTIYISPSVLLQWGVACPHI